MHFLTLVCAEPNLFASANKLAAALHLAPAQPEHPHSGLVLELNNDGLALYDAESQAGSVRVDFSSNKTLWRQGQKELIIQALGRQRPGQVVDATAGLGRDAFVMASAGIQVTMIEQHPVVHALLADGLRRALEHDSTRDVARRLTLVQGNAVDQLSLQKHVDLVYLDPMYPHREKSAAVKKEMQLFQQLLGEPPDTNSLLWAAREAAERRVVVKRPVKGGYLADTKPSYNIKGRSTRFDIYLCSG